MIIASIDIGTNTIILLIAEVDIRNKKIDPLYNEQRIPRIGKGLNPGKSIPEEKIAELTGILDDYNSLIKRFNCEKTIITATNALRIASNGDKIKKLLINKFKFDINIITGEEEAELTFMGAVFPFNDNSNSVVIDIGGGSTEIIYGNRNKIEFKKSYQVGVVTARENFLRHSPPAKAEISNLQNELANIFNDIKERDFTFNRAIAIAGTPTTLAAIKLNLHEYDENILEGHNLNSAEIKDLISELSKLNDAEIIDKFKAVIKGREDVILSGAIILLFIMDLLKIDNILVSTKGIRYGAVLKEFFT
jgi:exopolyphosphatase / guanosine-5'-triphosphate,3'-diphosphate pyrophosphatase